MAAMKIKRHGTQHSTLLHTAKMPEGCCRCQAGLPPQSLMYNVELAAALVAGAARQLHKFFAPRTINRQAIFMRTMDKPYSQ